MSDVIKLSTIERITLQQLIGEIDGDSRVMRKAVRLLDVLEFTEAERDYIKLRQVSDTRVEWDHPEKEWELEFKDGNDFAFLKATFKNKRWVGINPRVVVAIEDRLGIKPSDD